MILNCPRILVASLTIENGCLIVKGVCVRSGLVDNVGELEYGATKNVVSKLMIKNPKLV